jgi:hypothetical protein
VQPPRIARTFLNLKHQFWNGKVLALTVRARMREMEVLETCTVPVVTPEVWLRSLCVGPVLLRGSSTLAWAVGSEAEVWSCPPESRARRPDHARR